MSDDTAAVAPVSAPVVEAAPVSAPLTGRAALRERLSAANAEAAKLFSKPSKPAAPSSSETPNQETASAVADLTQAGVEESKLEKKPGETQARYETRIAQLILSNQRTEAKALEHKGALEKANAELTELKAKFADASSDPVKALKLAGMTPDEMAQAMLDGKLTKAEEKVAKQELSPELLEVIAEHKKFKAEKEAQTAAVEAAEIRKGNIKLIEDAKASVADRFPVLELIANDRLLDAYEQIAKATGEEPDFSEFAEKMQANIVAEVSAAVSHAGTLKALIKAKPELKAFLVKELGLTAPVAAAPIAQPAIAPRTLTNAVAAENPTKGRPLSPADRRALANEEARKIFSQLKGG